MVDLRLLREEDAGALFALLEGTGMGEAEFVAAIRQGTKPPLDGREGRKAVAVVEACYRSARTGRAVKLT